ncbi:DUF5683 domain-containing protein [Niabella ginsengisoli]|uniref:DUF5683 domain-containing protein n=1 Tax=Niabella ginsengisoli TaxID=522298 RepID=A0ABS9SM66_9BACT|nr:DUF5683 domain-containing protein [Niabella ginsengisoli]MCH5599381.1 DUF5683 domain-containing protein [Niabella ginsengisoli]
MNTFIKPLLTLATIFIFQATETHAQNFDTATLKLANADASKNKDPNHTKTKERIPRKAATLSAILPGLGQIYNRKIWKVPIVYAALGTTGGLFLYNLKWYQKYRQGVLVIDILNKSKTKPGDSTAYFKLDRVVKITYENSGIEAVRFSRNDLRKNVDYAAIYFAVAWALNVIDATVDAHLSGFDVSPDLSLKIQPDYNILNRTAGLSLALKIK